IQTKLHNTGAWCNQSVGAGSAVKEAIVIGGGAVGLAAARELRRRGLTVTLLERGQPGRAASWASAGIVGAPTGPQNEPGFQLQKLSRRLWPGLARDLTAESGLDPE